MADPPVTSAPSRSSSRPAGGCARTSAGCWRTSPSRLRWRSATPGCRPARRPRHRLDGQTEALEASRRRLFEAENVGAAGWRPPSPATCCPTSRCCPRSWTGCRSRPTRRRRGGARPDGGPDDCGPRPAADPDPGIFPTTLARSGIGPALASHFAGARDGTPLHVDSSAADRRFPSRVETAAYFCCTRAVEGPARDGRRHHPRPWRPGARPAGLGPTGPITRRWSTGSRRPADR